MTTRFLLIVCFVLMTDILSAQNIANDTIVDCENVSWQLQPDLRGVSDYKRGTGWRDFIEKFAVYPSKARQNGISGTSVVSVVIYKDGSKGKPEIVQSSDSLLDAEALRIVSLMPEFKTGHLNVRMKMPVHFVLYGDGKTRITTHEKVQPSEYKVNAYFAMYFGLTVLYYNNVNNPEVAFLDSNPFFNGDLEIYGGHIFRNGKKLAFSLGGGLRNMHYNFTKAFSLKTENNRVYGDSSMRETDKFIRHNLRVINLSVPLGVHFRFNSKKIGKYELSCWLMGNMRVGCRELQVYKANGARKKNYIKDDFLVRRFSCDCALEFTNHCVSVRVTYAPSSFFKKDVSPFAHYIILSMGFRLFERQIME